MRLRSPACIGVAVAVITVGSSLLYGGDRVFGSRDPLSTPEKIRAGELTHYYQLPILDEEYLSSLLFPYLAADRSCDQSIWCGGQTQRSAAVGHPMEYDVTPESVRLNEIVVWGVYDGGPPPLMDSFSVLVQWTNGAGRPGFVTCSESGISGTRELVATVLGKDVYRHVLKLSQACTVDYFGGMISMTHYWVEVFNDSGASGDWLWLAGYDGWIDWFGNVSLTVEANQAPGVVFGFHSQARAFEINVGPPGVTQALQLSRLLPDGRIRLDWAPDCGSADRYSLVRGDLAQGWSSAAADLDLCQIEGTTLEIEAGEGTADFYLVVPLAILTPEWHATGSYGADSEGNPRPEPQWNQRCSLQRELDSCAP